MKLKNPLNDIRISFKLIGAFFAIACLSGIVGFYSINQINTLNSAITNLVEINVEQADWSMETIIAMESELITIHAAMIGEEDMIGEFSTSHEVMVNGLNNLSVLLRGTEKESLLLTLEANYNSFVAACNGTNSVGGVFNSMEEYLLYEDYTFVQFNLFATIAEDIDANCKALQEYASSGSFDNHTVAIGAANLCNIMWRSFECGAEYLRTPLEDSTTEYNGRLAIRRKFVDDTAFTSEGVASLGLEKEFMDNLAILENQVKVAGSSINQTANVSALTVEKIRELFEFSEHGALSLGYDPFAANLRCPNDGIFTSYSLMVTSWDAADTYMNSADEISINLATDLEELELWVEEQMDLAIANAKNTYNDSVSLVLMIAVIAIIIGSTIGFVLSQSITRPLSMVVKTSIEVAQGNLAVDTSNLDKKRKDEIGKLGSAFGTMVDKVIGDMVNLITQAQTSAETVATSAEELASTSEEVNALSEEIAATIQQISRGSTSQSELSVSATTDVNNISEIIDQSLKDIEAILGIIDDIAGQTNILALNAAIEAARAGEYGRGFAVVADNVRRLAEETKNNSRDISKLTEDIVTNIGGSILKLQETLQSFAAQSEEFSASSEEVAAATEEQTAAMNQMTTAAQDLTRLGEELSQLVSQYEVQ